MLTADTSANEAEHMRTAAQARLAMARSIPWLGQTVASLCWITSVFVSGISSAGDWLQLAAASSWLTANLATLATADA